MFLLVYLFKTNLIIKLSWYEQNSGKIQSSDIQTGGPRMLFMYIHQTKIK